MLSLPSNTHSIQSSKTYTQLLFNLTLISPEGFVTTATFYSQDYYYFWDDPPLITLTAYSNTLCYLCNLMTICLCEKEVINKVYITCHGDDISCHAQCMHCSVHGRSVMFIFYLDYMLWLGHDQRHLYTYGLLL